MRSRLAVVLAVLAGVALVGALFQRSHGRNQAATTTTARPKLNPNRVVTPKGALPGSLLIADRGNDRILLVDPQRRTLWSFPTARDRALHRKLVYDDDTFVQPGGKALVTNEEDNGDILSSSPTPTAAASSSSATTGSCARSAEQTPACTTRRGRSVR